MASKHICKATTRVLRATATPSVAAAAAVNSRQALPLSRLHYSPQLFTSSRQQQRQPLSTSRRLFSQPQSTPTPSKIYSFSDIQSLIDSSSSDKQKTTNDNNNKNKNNNKVLLIDVREPAEVASTGTIPTAVNIPVSSSPDSFFLSAEEFETRHGFERPGSDQEVVFFCKAGVRSNAAARLAAQAGFGGKIGEFPGSWNEWVEKGGRVERL